MKITGKIEKYSALIGMLLLQGGLTCACDNEYCAVDDRRALSFISQSKDLDKNTRATFGGIFGVTVFHSTSGKITDITETSFFDQIHNKPVVNKSAYWEIQESGKRYFWPDGGALFFTADAPYRVTDPYLVARPYNFKTTYVYKQFENDGHTDLQYSDVVFLSAQKNAGSPVPIRFNHALSLVSVEIKVASTTDGRETWKTTLNHVELKNVRNRGHVTIQPEGTSGKRWTTSNGGSWNTEGVTTYEKELSYHQPILLTTDPVRTIHEKMVIPQVLDNQRLLLDFNVESTIKYKDPDGREHKEEINNHYVKELLLKKQDLLQWKMGQHIQYTVILNYNKPIEFEASIYSWNEDVTLQ